MESSEAISALAALAHEGRLAAFRLLVQAGPDGLPAGEIAARLGMPASTLSANLTLLSNARLVSSRRDGRSIIYRANYAAMSGLLGFLVEDCCSGSSEIQAPLAAALSSCQPGRRIR